MSSFVDKYQHKNIVLNKKLYSRIPPNNHTKNYAFSFLTENHRISPKSNGTDKNNKHIRKKSSSNTSQTKKIIDSQNISTNNIKKIANHKKRVINKFKIPKIPSHTNDIPHKRTDTNFTNLNQLVTEPNKRCQRNCSYLNLNIISKKNSNPSLKGKIFLKQALTRNNKLTKSDKIIITNYNINKIVLSQKNNTKRKITHQSFSNLNNIKLTKGCLNTNILLSPKIRQDNLISSQNHKHSNSFANLMMMNNTKIKNNKIYFRKVKYEDVNTNKTTKDSTCCTSKYKRSKNIMDNINNSLTFSNIENKDKQGTNSSIDEGCYEEIHFLNVMLYQKGKKIIFN